MASSPGLCCITGESLSALLCRREPPFVSRSVGFVSDVPVCPVLGHPVCPVLGHTPPSSIHSSPFLLFLFSVT